PGEAARDTVVKGEVPEDDLPALYSLAKVFVFLSFAEGFGLTPLEAMAVGTPVLVSTAPALTELVADAGDYVDPWDIDAAAAVLLRLVESQELRFMRSVAGRNRAALFTWESSARNILAIFEALSGDSKS